MASAKCDLLDLWKIFVDHLIEDEFADIMKRYKVLRPDFRGIQNIEVEVVFVLLLDDLDGKRPFGIAFGGNCFFKIFSMEVYSNEERLDYKR